MASGCSAFVCRYWRIIGVAVEISPAASGTSTVLCGEGAERRLACGPGMFWTEDATGLPYHARPTPHFRKLRRALTRKSRAERPATQWTSTQPVIYRVLRKSR